MKKEKVKNIIKKIVEDKNKINEHIRKGGNLNELKEFKFVNPLPKNS
jgi:hypothetical protein